MQTSSERLEIKYSISTVANKHNKVHLVAFYGALDWSQRISSWNRSWVTTKSSRAANKWTLSWFVYGLNITIFKIIGWNLIWTFVFLPKSRFDIESRKSNCVASKRINRLEPLFFSYHCRLNTFWPVCQTKQIQRRPSDVVLILQANGLL